jgi:hypothetical protein
MKMMQRLIGLALFLFAFVCAAAVVLALSLGVIQLPEAPTINIEEELHGEGPISSGEIAPSDFLDQLFRSETGTLSERVYPRPLFSRVPTPFDLSTDPKVIGANIGLAILMALIFGISTNTLNNLLRDEEATIRGWLDAIGIFKLFPKGAAWLARRAIPRGCLTLPIIMLVFALYGIIFAFLEEGTSIASRQGVFLAITMAFSVGLISLAGDIAQRIVARFWRVPTTFGVYPANLLVAAVTVVGSRVFRLIPGIAFGTPGGVDIKLEGPRKEAREATLSFVTLLTIGVLGGLGWAISGGVVLMVNRPVDTRILNTMAALLTAAQNTSLAIFLVALETAFFESIPMAYSLGRAIFQRTKIGWVIIFLPIAMFFNHALLNPSSGFLDSFMEANVRMMWFVLFVLVGVTGALWFYFNVVREMLNQPGPQRPM